MLWISSLESHSDSACTTDRAFPRRCLRHSGCSSARESRYRSRACGLSEFAVLRDGWRFPETLAMRSGEAAAPGAYPFSFNPRCKALHCSFQLSSVLGAVRSHFELRAAAIFRKCWWWLVCAQWKGLFFVFFEAVLHLARSF